MRRIWVLGLALSAVWAPIAEASPQRTAQVAHHGFIDGADGAGCTHAQITAPIGSSDLVGVEPDVGDSVGIDAQVLAVDVVGGEVRWSVGPTPAMCADNDEINGVGNWAWATWEDTSWSVTFRRNAYAVTASRLGGIKSIAGFRVRPRNRRAVPDLRRVRQALGRPTSVRRGRGAARVVCTVRWRQLGLVVRFVNFGLAPPCRHGVLQAATIEGHAAGKWVARIGRAPAVGLGTSLAWLEQNGIGSMDEFGQRSWTFAEVYFPVGDAGYVPSVSGLFTGTGRLRGDDRVRGFELWIGAGGD